MSQEPSGEGLHIDADWKEEARREKERLAKEQQASPSARRTPQDIGFADLINVLAMQAAIGLGGVRGPGGEQIPPNPQVAKYHIDLLDLLEQKTRGNLTPEEQNLLDSVTYELRMQYVSMVSHPHSAPPREAPGARP